MKIKSIVLVHGAFADGSGWKPVVDILERDGYTVYVAQIPETTFAADVAATRFILDRSGPCVLVGHSYGGMVITEAGEHVSVKSLVYVAAFQPTVGESAAELNGKMPPASNSIAPVGGGVLQVKPESFQEDFAADLPKALAHFHGSLWCKGYGCRLVKQVQLCRCRQAGPNDQPGPRAFHDEQSQVGNDRASGQPCCVYLTRQRRGRADRGGGKGRGVEVRHWSRTPRLRADEQFSPSIDSRHFWAKG